MGEGALPEVAQDFVLLDRVCLHAFLCRDFPKLGRVQTARPLDVKGTATLVSLVVTVGPELLDFCSLWEVNAGYYLFDVVLLPPFDHILKHFDDSLHFELASAAEPQQIVVVILFEGAECILFNMVFELG